MSKFNSILVPIDLSEPDAANPALERAVNMAFSSSANLGPIKKLRAILGTCAPRTESRGR